MNKKNLASIGKVDVEAGGDNNATHLDREMEALSLQLLRSPSQETRARFHELARIRRNTLVRLPVFDE